MKVTVQEMVSRKEWLHKELLNSLTGDIITKAANDQFYDVKLLVNGICLPEYHPDQLYKMIGSSYEKAFNDSNNLK